MAFAVVVVLAALVIPATSHLSAYATQVKSVSNMRQLGVAARLYANDHDQQLPGHTTSVDPASPPPDQWPALFCTYLSPVDPRVFVDLNDPNSLKLAPALVVSNAANNTGFVYNGFDELGADNQPPATVRLQVIDHPSEVVLLGQKVPGSATFCVDLLFQPLTNLVNLLNPTVYDGGANYLFVDGSIRFLKQTDYNNTLWLADKTVTLPVLPLP